MKIRKSDLKKLIREVLEDDDKEQELDEEGEIVRSLAAQKGVENPQGLAAHLGRKKYGKEKMKKAAAKGKKLS